MKKRWFDDWNVTKTQKRIEVSLPHVVIDIKKISIIRTPETEWIAQCLDCALTELTNKKTK